MRAALLREVEKLKGHTPAAAADQQTAELLPKAARVALVGVRGGFVRLCSSLEWADAVAPFGFHLTQKGIENEMERRLNVLAPIVEQIGGRGALVTFVNCLARPELLTGKDGK